MATYKNCTEDIITRIENAFSRCLERDVLINEFSVLRIEIQNAWNHMTIKNGVGTKDCKGLNGHWSGNTILLCGLLELRLEATLLHEMVHECSGVGSELDSEALEQACYLNTSGIATRPTSGDWPKFRKNKNFNGNKTIKMGKHVIWDRTSGEVWVRIKINGKDAQGTSLFKSNYWIDPEPHKA